VPVGSCLASVRTLCDRWGWTDKTVMAFLRRLVASGRISEPTPTAAGSLISVSYLALHYATDEAAPTEIPTAAPTATPTATPTRTRQGETVETVEKEQIPARSARAPKPAVSKPPKLAVVKPEPDPRTGLLVGSMIDAWREAGIGEPASGKIAAAAGKLVKAGHPHGEIEDRWWTFLRSGDHRYGGPARFTEHYGTYASDATVAASRAKSNGRPTKEAETQARMQQSVHNTVIALEGF
jgi:hypothetical protein